MKYLAFIFITVALSSCQIIKDAMSNNSYPHDTTPEFYSSLENVTEVPDLFSKRPYTLYANVLYQGNPIDTTTASLTLFIYGEDNNGDDLGLLLLFNDALGTNFESGDFIVDGKNYNLKIHLNGTEQVSFDVNQASDIRNTKIECSLLVDTDGLFGGDIAYPILGPANIRYNDAHRAILQLQ